MSLYATAVSDIVHLVIPPIQTSNGGWHRRQRITSASTLTRKAMKTLHLVLKHKWYDMIDVGEKPEEYREITPYWEKRLLDYEAIKRDYKMLIVRRFLIGKGVDPLDYPRGFTHVRFHRGYTSTTMTFEFKELTIGKGNPAWGCTKRQRSIHH